MKLIVQPDAGIAPVVTAIKQAKQIVDVLIFRLDRMEIARALEAAVARGVRVRALTAHHQSRRHQESSASWKWSCSQAGVTVSRTADDLVRYHGKMMIVDSRILHVYGFNFTGLDMEKSRSFGIVTKNHKLVNEAIKLFEADFDRQPYTPGVRAPHRQPGERARAPGRFIKGARKQLLIYDPQVSDDAMLRLITERIKAGVDVRDHRHGRSRSGTSAARSFRASGCTSARSSATASAPSSAARACAASSSRSGARSASSSPTRVVVEQMQQIFEQDWAQTETGRKEAKKAEKAEKKDEKRGRVRRITQSRNDAEPISLRAARFAVRVQAYAVVGRFQARVLRRPPEIHRRHAVHAADRAVRRARLRRRELAADVVDGVALERHARIAALLRAVVHQAVLADVEVARAGAAAPLVRLAVGQVVLEAANPRIEVLEAPATGR